MTLLIELIFLSLTLIFILLSYIFFILKRDFHKLFLIISFIFFLFWLVFRSMIVLRLPFSNSYESILFFGFLYFTKFLFFGNYKDKDRMIILIPVTFFLIIALFLPLDLKIPKLLSPALRSFWMYIHIPAYFFGYVSLTSLFILSGLSLFLKKEVKNQIISEQKQSFFFMTVGMVTGAFWGDLSWGRFWGWDPKEIWALVTWLILAATFHIKHDKVKYLFFALSFFSMLFTYFGVMFLFSGLHSYK